MAFHSFDRNTLYFEKEHNNSFELIDIKTNLEVNIELPPLEKESG